MTPNHPSLWRSHYRWPDAASHKYSRGALFVAGGDAPGAAMLAAEAALRAAAGLVMVALPEAQAAIRPPYAIMQQGYTDLAGFNQLWNSKPFRAALIGSGAGCHHRTVEQTLLLAESGKPMLVDADAITVFAGTARKQLASALPKESVLTPHMGEFQRMFGSCPEDREGRATAARNAAHAMGATLVLKGSETIIASPDGIAYYQPTASPWLATAGSGDVLAGTIAALLASGMSGLYAAACGVWLHSHAAALLGEAFIADDLPRAISRAVQEMKKCP